MPTQPYPKIGFPKAGEIIMCSFPEDITDPGSSLFNKPVVVLSTLTDAKGDPVLYIAPLRTRSITVGAHDDDIGIPDNQPFIRPKPGREEVIALGDSLLLPFTSEFFFRANRSDPQGVLQQTNLRERFTNGFLKDILDTARSMPFSRIALTFIDRSRLTTRMHNPMLRP